MEARTATALHYHYQGSKGDFMSVEGLRHCPKWQSSPLPALRPTMPEKRWKTYQMEMLFQVSASLVFHT